MTLQQLRCFIALSRTLHYTEAARQLYLSQPSLSYAISTLENELGVKLFSKSGNTITQTEYARELLPYAMVAVNAVDTGYEKIKQMKNNNIITQTDLSKPINIKKHKSENSESEEEMKEAIKFISSSEIIGFGIE